MRRVSIGWAGRVWRRLKNLSLALGIGVGPGGGAQGRGGIGGVIPDAGESVEVSLALDSIFSNPYLGANGITIGISGVVFNKVSTMFAPPIGGGIEGGSGEGLGEALALGLGSAVGEGAAVGASVGFRVGVSNGG